MAAILTDSAAGTAATAPAAAPEASVGGMPLWKRVGHYLVKVSPNWASQLFAYGLGKAAGWVALAFLIVLLLPHLSVWSVSFVSWLLPEAAGKAVREMYVTGIHKGYDIDKVREQLKDEASKDALSAPLRVRRWGQMMQTQRCKQEPEAATHLSGAVCTFMRSECWPMVPWARQQGSGKGS